MTSRHLSIRLETGIFERLEAQSRLVGQTRSQVAKTLLEEGLRMEAHPGIVFRPGPAGRRPGLAGGPDVWEVARVFRRLDREGDETVGRAARLTGLSAGQVRTALRYYAEYGDEIDAWIARVDEAAASAEQSWRREHALLRS